MGLFLSVVISYAGVVELTEVIKHILSGLVPETEPDFQDLVEYYKRLLSKSQKSNNPSSTEDWTDCPQGYLCLTEDEDGLLKSAAVKYYGSANSTAILFSTKISSFGQDSVDDTNIQANGDCKSERYESPRTKTLISNTSDSFSVGQRNRSPTSNENVSDPTRFSENSFEHDNEDEKSDAAEKLTWHYRPKSPIQQALPEIHFQTYEDDDEKGVHIINDEFLRSLDGIKYRPLQRSDPSGRRRSFKKRHSSSSNSSRESRASKEEELKMFTSLEEAEFEQMSRNEGGGSAPNLAARSHSRSQSRENSDERINEDSVDKNADEDTEAKLRLKDKKLDSFQEQKEDKEVTEDEEDFWGNTGD